jgi:hypothetical protein
MRKIYAFVGLLAVALAGSVGTTVAATSIPTAGSWSGHLEGVSPARGLTFSVSASGRRRTVNLFAAAGTFTERCPAAHGASTGLSSIPSATVNSAGTFRAVGSELTGFGSDTWTVIGSFKNKHAAAGTVAIVIAIDPVRRCKFTIRWTAALEPAAPPTAGATYRGTTGNDQAAGGAPVTFQVSGDGKHLTAITFKRPTISGPCPGIGSANPLLTGHGVPIHNGKFTFNAVTGTLTNGTGTKTTNTITGQFLSGRKASGTISTVTDEAGTQTCRGSDTWTAHA